MDLSKCSAFEKSEYEDQRELAIKLAKKGLSNAVIAKRVTSIGRPVSATTVSVWTKRVEGRPKKRARRVLRSDGAVYTCLKDAALEAGCAAKTIERHCKTGKPIGDYSYKLVEDN